MGDCAGSPYFTHIAFDDFRVVRDNLAGGNRVTTGRQVLYCMFIDPDSPASASASAKQRTAGSPIDSRRCQWITCFGPIRFPKLAAS